MPNLKPEEFKLGHYQILGGESVKSSHYQILTRKLYRQGSEG